MSYDLSPKARDTHSSQFQAACSSQIRAQGLIVALCSSAHPLASNALAGAVSTVQDNGRRVLWGGSWCGEREGSENEYEE